MKLKSHTVSMAETGKQEGSSVIKVNFRPEASEDVVPPSNNQPKRPISHRVIGGILRAMGKHPGLTKKAAIVVTATAITAVGAHEVGKAIDRQYGLGEYGHQKTAQEQTMDFRAGTIEGDKILNGSINITIKTEDGSELTVRSEPKVPDLSKREKDNRIAWNQIMAIKTNQDNPEILIKDKNEFSISGQVHFVNGDNPIGATGNDGAYVALIAILGNGEEKKIYINSSPLTRSHLTSSGILTDPDGKNPLTITKPHS